MTAPVFIGNEITAAGYRLAGVHVHTVKPENARAAFEKLLAEHPYLVLVGESHVALIGAARLSEAIANANPPVLVVSDTPARSFHDSLPETVRQELGVTG